ncbi:hypothetical protein C0Z20_02575 [Trinickia symbiotica]|uniref:Uncharacterized protein n=1 Tax=Trinickia symbiotica TaxID=863227 RepID=A0A2N7XAI2_9BURK|nr:hypothetical protein C0Z20_02575 [Trinickia symbiotica]
MKDPVVLSAAVVAAASIVFVPPAKPPLTWPWQGRRNTHATHRPASTARVPFMIRAIFSDGVDQTPVA